MTPGKATRPSGKHPLVPSQVVEEYVPVKNPAIWGDVSGPSWIDSFLRWFMDDAPMWVVAGCVIGFIVLVAWTIAAYFGVVAMPSRV